MQTHRDHRHVEICEDNLDIYSTQFTRLLLSAASEVDVVAKILCGQIDPHGTHGNRVAVRTIQ